MERPEVQTVFYQGMQCSATQASKYLDERGFVSPHTGERVFCTRGQPLLLNYFAEAPEIDEITLKERGLSLWQLPLLPYYAITAVKHWYLSTTVERELHDAPLAGHTLGAHSLDLRRISVGQHTDMESHRAKVLALDPHCDVVLWGVSRGAATTLNAIALNEYERLQRFRLVVLEGCLDHVESTIDASYPRPLAWVVRQLLRRVTSYEEEGPQPIRSAQRFPKSVPVLFVTSRVDRVVPMQATLAVANAVAATGHEAVHLLVLERASHSMYMMHNDADSTRYRDCVHALYEHYDLPHEPAFAAGGREWVQESYVRPSSK